MQYLIKTSLNQLQNVVNSMQLEIDEAKREVARLSATKNSYIGHCMERDLDHELQDAMESHKALSVDFGSFKYFAESYFIGNLFVAKLISRNFDTYLRDKIPHLVYELVGGSLVHAKDRSINPEINKNIIIQSASVIINSYNLGNEEEAKSQEVHFFNKYSSTSTIKTQSDNSLISLLIDCRDKLISNSDSESKMLADRLKKAIKEQLKS